MAKCILACGLLLLLAPSAVAQTSGLADSSGPYGQHITGSLQVDGPIKGDISGTSVTATGGTTARTQAVRAADVSNVLDYGADSTGTTDSTTAIRAALATSKSVFVPCGTYHITNTLVVAASRAQRFYGEGNCSILTVSNDFNASAAEVVGASGIDPNTAEIDHLQLQFSQPSDFITTANGAGSGNSVTVASVSGIVVGNYVYDATTKSNIASLTTVSSISGNVLTLSASAASIADVDSLHFGPSRAQFQTLASGCTVTAGGTGCAYPWAVQNVSSAWRPKIHNLLISGSWDGINVFGGNGFQIEDINYNALDIGIQIDHIVDSGTVAHVKEWNWGLYPNQTSLVLTEETAQDGHTQCLSVGQTFGVYSDVECYLGSINLLTTFDAASFQGVVLDGANATFIAPAGIASTSYAVISNLHAEAVSSATANCLIDVSSGQVVLSVFHLFDAVGPSLCVRGGVVAATGGVIVPQNNTNYAVLETGGEMFLSGNIIEAPGGTGQVSLVQISGGQYQILANSFYGVVAAGVSEVLVSAAYTSGNAIAGNSAPQGVVVASGQSQGFSWPNSDRSDNGGSVGGLVVPLVSTVVPQQTLGTVGNGTLVNGHLFSGVLTRSGTQSGVFTDTTPTAATIVSNFHTPVAGQITRLRIMNTTGFTETIAGGTGVTMAGTHTIATGTWRDFDIVLTTVTSGSQAVQINNSGTGNN